MKDFEKIIANQLRGLNIMLLEYSDQLDEKNENAEKVQRIDDARQLIKQAAKLLEQD